MSRNPFTSDERQLVAEFLAKRLSDDRSAPSVYKEFVRKYPNTKHSAESWMEHYKKAGKDDINRRIAKIKKQKKKDKAETDSVVARAARIAEAAEPSSSKSKGKKRAREPSPEEEEEEQEDADNSSEDDSDFGEVNDSPKPKRKTTRTSFDDNDFDDIVRYMADRGQHDWTVIEVYNQLAAKNKRHTFESWKTYHANNRQDIDAAVLRCQRKKWKAKDGIGAKPAKAEKDKQPAKPERHSSVKAIPVSSPEADPEPPRPKKKSVTVAEVVIHSPKKLKSTSAASAVASTSKSAISPAKPVKAAKQKERTATASASVEPAGEEQPSEFTDKDVDLLVHKIAQVDVNDGPKREAYEFLALKHPTHSYDEWRAYYTTHRLELDPRITAKVLEALQARERKKGRAEMEASQEQVQPAFTRKDKGKGKEVVRDDEEDQVDEEEDRLDEDDSPIVVEQAAPNEDAKMEDGEEEGAEGDEDEEEEEEEDQLILAEASELSPELVDAATQPATQAQAQDPSPPTPQPTPPSSHSQSQSQSQGAAHPAPAHESNSTGEEPSTQNDDSHPIADDQQFLPLVDHDEREHSLPSPFLKADQFPAEDDNDSLIDSDDRRMEALLAEQEEDDEQEEEEEEPKPVVYVTIGGRQYGWDHLPPEQNQLVDGVFETQQKIIEWKQKKAAEAEAERVAAEEQARLEEARLKREEEEAARRIVEEEEERKREEIRKKEEERRLAEERKKAEARRIVEERERAEERKRAQEQERREEEKRKKAEQLKKAEEVKKARAEEQARRDQEAAAAQKAKEDRRRAAEEEKKAQAREAEAARRRAQAAEEEKKAKEEREAQEVEEKRKAVVKASKQRAGSTTRAGSAARSVEATPPVARRTTRKTSTVPPSPVAVPVVVPVAVPVALNTRSSVAPPSEAKPVVVRSKRPRGSTASEAPTSANKKARVAAPPSSLSRPQCNDTPALQVALKERRLYFGLPKNGGRYLYSACSYTVDWDLVDQVCRWYSPTHRPEEGTAEYEQLRELVRQKVWSYDEDVIVLSGTKEAQAKLEQQKGKGTVEDRRDSLAQVDIFQVSELQRTWPWC